MKWFKAGCRGLDSEVLVLTSLLANADAKTAQSNSSETNFVFKQQRYLFRATLGSYRFAPAKLAPKSSVKSRVIYTVFVRGYNIFTYIFI